MQMGRKVFEAIYNKLKTFDIRGGEKKKPKAIIAEMISTFDLINHPTFAGMSTSEIQDMLFEYFSKIITNNDEGIFQKAVLHHRAIRNGNENREQGYHIELMHLLLAVGEQITGPIDELDANWAGTIEFNYKTQKAKEVNGVSQLYGQLILDAASVPLDVAQLKQTYKDLREKLEKAVKASDSLLALHTDHQASVGLSLMNEKLFDAPTPITKDYIEAKDKKLAPWDANIAQGYYSAIDKRLALWSGKMAAANNSLAFLDTTVINSQNYIVKSYGHHIRKIDTEEEMGKFSKRMNSNELESFDAKDLVTLADMHLKDINRTYKVYRNVMKKNIDKAFEEIKGEQGKYKNFKEKGCLFDISNEKHRNPYVTLLSSYQTLIEEIDGGANRIGELGAELQKRITAQPPATADEAHISDYKEVANQLAQVSKALKIGRDGITAMWDSLRCNTDEIDLAYLTACSLKRNLLVYKKHIDALQVPMAGLQENTPIPG